MRDAYSAIAPKRMIWPTSSIAVAIVWLIGSADFRFRGMSRLLPMWERRGACMPMSASY